MFLSDLTIALFVPNAIPFWGTVLKLPENNENAVKVAFCFAVAFARTLQDLKVKQSDIKKLDIVKIQAADGGKETGEGEEGEASPEVCATSILR